ncbi:MAG: NAD(P)/FAD-dependent oxidoreductase, partial [Gammaproteobacteria bacterium]|nr:NAD(P)/FAD-dependent oxidoreductase [Gammaproteobacteria bacterium]
MSTATAKPKRTTRKAPQATETAVPHHDIAIVGSGFSGLGMAIQLKKAGRHDFVLLERAAEIGGTWRDNHYPGAACDVPSHLYSFSFEPNPNWTRYYSRQAEILDYMRHCAAKYDLAPHVQVNSELVEARWDELQQHWHLIIANGRRLTARVLISGVGGLSRPALPNVKGLDQFQGTMFHSAEWNHDYDLRGKRVAVIGTGASAIQFVPEVAKVAGEVVLFQRTPPWIIPKFDGPISTGVRKLFSKLPFTRKLLRTGIYWQNEAFALGFIHPKIMTAAEMLARKHLKDQVKDPVLREKLTPNYTIGCKRILLSNNYYPALTRDNVNVVAAGVKEVRAHSVVASNGEEYPVDAIICGTGFDVANPFGPLKVIGKNGKDIREDVNGNVTAHLGVTVEGQPNLFLLLGPNTGLGHTSIIFMIEAQINYTLQALDAMQARKATAMEEKP